MHEITDTDAMFSVRQMPWHGLGEVLTDYPTRAEAQKIAHPWEPVQETLYRQVPGFDAQGLPTSTFEPVETHVGYSRSDNGFLLGVNKTSYEPILNDEMYDIAEAIEDGAKGEVQYETGGSLNGGSRVWLMLRLREPLTVKGDPNGATIPFYSLQNAHDGSASFRGQATMIRVVCANTSQLADLDARARGTEFKFHHSKNVKTRIEEACQALAGWRAGLESWQIQMTEMVNTKVSKAGQQEFVERFIPGPPPGLGSKRTLENVEVARDGLRLVMAGETQEGISGTAYGLVQAASEWSEWVRKAHTPETRFRRAVLDRNDVISGAVKLAREAALV